MTPACYRGHREHLIRAWNGEEIKRLSAAEAWPDRRWDSHHWSNHPDFIAAHGDADTGEVYLIQISNNNIFRVTWSGKCKDPDLFVRGAVPTVGGPGEVRAETQDRPQSNWPARRRDLLFAWRTLDHGNEVYNEHGQRQGTSRVTPSGFAVYGRHHEMRTHQGAFTLETSGVDFSKHLQESRSISLGLTVKPARREQEGVIAWIGNENTALLALFQIGGDMFVESGGERTRVGALNTARPTHFLFIRDKDTMTVWREGRVVSRSENLSEPDGFGQLMLGAGPGNDTFWDGTFEGVALWAATLDEEEAALEFQRDLERRAGRKDVERFEDHPQLESDLLLSETEALTLPMFYAVQPLETQQP